MKIVFEIDLAEELAGEFLQYMRDFDMKHDPLHEGKVTMTITMKSRHSSAEMKKILEAITPRPEFFEEIKLKK